MDRDIGAFSVLLAFIMLLVLFLAAPATAGEIRVGGGINCGDLVGDGAWIQQGLPHEITRCKEALTINYVGNTGIYWLDWSVGGFYRRGTQIKGEYVSDNCYGAGVFEGSVGGVSCHHYRALIQTKVIGITFTVNPIWRITHKFSLSPGVGVSVFGAQTKAVLDNPKGVCPDDKPCHGHWFRRGGVSPYIDLTAKYGQWFITAFSAPLEFAPETPSHGNEGLIAGYAFKF